MLPLASLLLVNKDYRIEMPPENSASLVNIDNEHPPIVSGVFTRPEATVR